MSTISGVYSIYHQATKTHFLNYGDVLFNYAYDVLTLTFGVHRNKLLQKLYNIKPEISLVLHSSNDTLEEMQEALKDQLIVYKKQKVVVLNPLNEITHPHVERLFSTHQIENSIYTDICVYAFHNKSTGKFYVGSGDKKTRQGRHLSLLKNNKHSNRKLQRAYNEDSNFEFTILDMKTRKEALALEQTFLDSLWGNPNLLNLARYVEVAGGFKNGKHTEESKRKISDAAKRFWKDPERHKLMSERVITYFNEMTEDEKNAYSAKRKEITSSLWNKQTYRDSVVAGVKKGWTPEVRNKVSKIVSARKNTSEAKLAQSKLAISYWKNPEYRKTVTDKIIEKSNRPEERLRRSLAASKYSNRPEVKEARLMATKQRFENPEYKAKNNIRMKIYNLERSKDVSIDGKIYTSIREASRLTGKSRSNIKKKIKNGIYLLI